MPIKSSPSRRARPPRAEANLPNVQPPADAINLTAAEVATILRCSVNALERLRMKGLAPPAFKMPGGKNATVLFPRDQFEDWRRRHTEEVRT